MPNNVDGSTPLNSESDSVSLPPFTALSRQGGYAHTLKGYFYTNLGGTLVLPLAAAASRFSNRRRSSSPRCRNEAPSMPRRGRKIASNSPATSLFSPSVMFYFQPSSSFTVATTRSGSNPNFL